MIVKAVCPGYILTREIDAIKRVHYVIVFDMPFTSRGFHVTRQWPTFRAVPRCVAAVSKLPLQKQVGFVFQASASSIEATTDVTRCSREAPSGLDRYAGVLRPPTSLLLMRMACTDSAAKRSNTMLGQPIDSCSLYARLPIRSRRMTIDECL